VGLVAHQPVEPQLRPRHDLTRERRRLVRRPHGRAPRADADAAAQRPPARVDIQRHQDRAAADLAHRRHGQVEVLDAVGHDRHALARPGGEGAQGSAVDRGIGDDEVLVAVARQPQRLGQREGEDPLHPRLERPLDQRAAADGLRGQPDRRPAGAAQEVGGVAIERFQVDHGKGRIKMARRAFEVVVAGHFAMVPPVG
jgi:hypothetical protein